MQRVVSRREALGARHGVAGNFGELQSQFLDLSPLRVHGFLNLDQLRSRLFELRLQLGNRLPRFRQFFLVLVIFIKFV